MALVTIEAKTAEGRTMDELANLIDRRIRDIGETTRDAVTATAINILSSLRSQTKKSPIVGNKWMYTIQEMPLRASWERKCGKFHRVARNSGGSVDWPVTNRCRNLAGKQYIKGEMVRVYKMQLFNEDLPETVYYAFATSEGQARDYIEKIILGRVLKKESGIAKNVLGFASAKLSTKSPAEEPISGRARSVAFHAAEVNIVDNGIASGMFSVEVIDRLKYATPALKGGEADLNLAMQRAANKTAGILHLRYVDLKLGADAPTPFPEVKKK